MKQRQQTLNSYINIQIEQISMKDMKNPKQFYSNLGESLATMKNSPFMRIGGSLPAQKQKNQFNEGQGLNYDPNRLFNPQKHRKQQQLLQQSLLDNQQQLQFWKTKKKQEQEAIEKIHYDLLKKNVEEDYQSEIRKMKEMREYQNANYYNIFAVQRGVCMLCGKCGKYEGCFHVSGMIGQESMEFMMCQKCGCPMNSHSPYRLHNPHQSFILQELVKCSINDSHIKVGYNIFGFRYLPKAQSSSTNISPPQLFSVLQTLNHPIISYRILTRKQFQIILLQTLITKNTNQINQGYLEALLSLLENIKNVDAPDNADEEWFEQLQMNQLYQNINENIKKLANQLLSATTTNIWSANSYEKVVVVLALGSDFATLTQLLKSQQFSQQLKQYKFVYSSCRSKRESILAAQNFFPTKFSLNYKIFLLPNNKNQRDHQSARFKDILDYNNCITFIEDPKNVERLVFEQAFSQFSANKINFVLGEELLSQRITRLLFKYVGKIGDNSFQIPFGRVPDYIQVSSQKHIKKSLRLLYPEIAYSQRCVIILRPFLLNQNYQQIIINLLRVNKFTILKRVKVKMSQPEAAYLATIQNITGEKQQQEYIKYMASGVCEIVLCSKRSGIYDAYALINGCFDGRVAPQRTRFRNKPVVQIKKGKVTYQSQLQANTPLPSPTIFKSLRETITIEDVLFPDQSISSHYLTNIKTGEILKTQSVISTSSQSTTFNGKKNNLAVSSVPPKFKSTLISSIASDNFNYWCLTSKSQTITEQLCSLFLPECTLIEPITILLKPHLSHLITPILNLLKQHKYHIIQHKKVLLPRVIAAQLVLNLQKVRATDKNQLKNVIDLYSSREIWIICVSKVSGRTEIMRMLSDFSFVGNVLLERSGEKRSGNLLGLGVQLADQSENISDEEMKTMLIPVWNSQELCLSLISTYLNNLEDAVKILEQYSDEIHSSTNNLLSSKNIVHRDEEKRLPKSDLFKILNYFVGSFYGVPITDLNLQTRLGILSYYTLQDMYIAKQQSWYYSLLSSKYSNYGPLLFQYREIKKTVLCIQSDRGVGFLEMIEKMYLEEKKKIEEKQLKQLENQTNYMFLNRKKINQRKSLVLFLWAKKLYEMLGNLAKIQASLKDYGCIIYKNGEHRGSISIQNALNQEKGFLEEMLDSFKEFPQICKNIKKLLMSRSYKQRYSPSNISLLPTFNNFSDSSSPSYHSSFELSLRIVQKSHTSKLVLMDQHQFIDPQNQHQQLNIKDLYSLTLYNIVPEIRTKYSMFAELYVLLLNKEFENSGDNFREEMYHEFLGLFQEMMAQVGNLEYLEYEIYLRLLVEYVRVCKNFMRGEEDVNQYEYHREGRTLFDHKNWIISLLKHYPDLRKMKKIDNDDVAGKKRKFLQRKHYFIRQDQQTQETIQKIQQKYQNVDINKFSDPTKESVLYNPLDPFHHRLANTENRINLLREDSQSNTKMRRAGINVEYQKNISQKQELLKQKIKREVDKFNIRDDCEQILHETGLQKQLWYRRTKGLAKQQQPQSKTNIAIQKQIGKFLQFKKEEQQKILQKQI